ncbi:MAG: hypothetical protein K0U72_17105 [Gammaproteobacteria bacterium]|nr:hypothetical protein [Gammaproteobacteria bacterium]
MNSNVHPLVAALVLLLTGVAIVTWMWFSGEAAGIGGPAELKKDRDGHVYVQIQSYLVEHDANGQFLRTHDLTDMGVELFLGSYAFFSNGDILLRRGPDPRSFSDNFRAYQRKTNMQAIAPESLDSGLFRCDLDTKHCSRFGEQGIDFKAAHGVFIDWTRDEVYVSDTTRHLLRKYSSEGVELAPPVSGFKFPNQLLIHEDRLLVVDTNHHVVRAVDARSESFGADIERMDVVPETANIERQTWPSHLARVGNDWWVNNMRTGMNQGGVYVFDDNWRFVRRARLPDGADPISLVAVGEEVWISDWYNDRVNRFSTSGKVLADLDSAGLEAVLEESRVQRRHYELLSYAGILLFSIVMVALLLQAFARSMASSSAEQLASSTQETSAAARPLMLQPDPKVLKKMQRMGRAAVVLLGIVALMLVYIILVHGKPGMAMKLLPAVAGMAAVVGLVFWLQRSNIGTSIKLEGNLLTLCDHTGRQSSCTLTDVRYNENAIATLDAVVFLGRPMAWIYDHDKLKEELFPRLSETQKISPIKMQQVLFEQRHPQGVVTVLALAGLGIYAGAVLSGAVSF